MDVPRMELATYEGMVEATNRLRQGIEQHSRSVSLPTNLPSDAATTSNSNDPRDQFIYESRIEGKTRAWIRNKVNARKSWEALESEQAVSAAAKRYSKRHDLPWPIKRTS